MFLLEYLVSIIVKLSPIENLKTGTIHAKNLVDINVASNCWICEGWTRMEFKLPKSKALGSNFKDLKKNSKDGTGPDKREFYVNLHLSFDGFKAVRMPEVPANYDEEEPHFTLANSENGTTWSAELFLLVRRAQLHG